MTDLCDGAYINTNLIVPHRKVRARVEHTFSRMKNYKILRDCQQCDDGPHHTVRAVARLHNLALAA